MSARWLRALAILGILAAFLLLVPIAAEPSTLGDSLVITAAVADLASTKAALDRGGREINTVSSMRGQMALHAVVAAGSITLAHEADKGGHRGWARVIRLAPVVIFGGAAVWNVTKGGRK